MPAAATPDVATGIKRKQRNKTSRLSAAANQPAPNDLSLNFSCTFKNIQDTSIAQHAADLVFKGIAVAAMNLKSGICIAPGHTCRQQFGHTGLDIAAMAFFFFVGSKISQFACEHAFDNHHGQLISHPWEFNNGLTKLFAFNRILPSKLKSTPAYTDSTRCRLDTRRLEGTHQLPEPLPPNTTQQRLRT